MKSIIGILFSISALAQVPEHGEFDRTKFYGFYRFTACEVSHNDPIWSQDPSGTYIEISDNHGREKNYLEMLRWNDNGSPLMPIWKWTDINLGAQKSIDEETHKLVGTSDSFSTTDGIYGFLSWNYKDINIGWGTVQLSMDAQGNVSYLMQLKHEEDSYTKEERCSLHRIKAPR